MAPALERRIKALEVQLGAMAADAPRLVLLVGPDGPSSDEQAQITQAEQAGREVTLIELVPGQRPALDAAACALPTG